MKRSRTEISAVKPQKKCRDTAAKVPTKPRRESREEKRPPPAAIIADSSPSPSPEQDKEEAQVAWDFVGECGWWWGVEEDLLLGWFPFGEEDFICSESRGGGAFWEDFHDIWQLQHIHEIPSSRNN